MGALAPNQSLESLPESGAKSIPCRGLLVESMKAPQKKWGTTGPRSGGQISPRGRRAQFRLRFCVPPPGAKKAPCCAKSLWIGALYGCTSKTARHLP